MRRLVPMLLILLPVTAAAQLLPAGPIGRPITPSLPGVLPEVDSMIDRATERIDRAATLPRAVAALADARLARIDALIRDHPAEIARDEHGDAARAGEVIVTDADEALVASAAAAGFTLVEQQRIDGLGIGYARFRAPAGASLPGAIRAMRKLAGKRDVSADPLHFASGAVGAPTASKSPGAAPVASGAAMRIGIIDGAIGGAIRGAIAHAGFARGAGTPNNHASAIASLLVGAPGVRGAAAGATLWSADVYGVDPAGGNATAIARAIGWLASEHVPVTIISLVGPANPLLARVVQAAQAQGMMIVAAVGNDGPAAPPAFPASYPGVIAVTGVDGRDRALIEAGRALHLDYAAPGADMLASDAGGRAVAVRGTSFAVPLVAGRIAAVYPLPAPPHIPAVLRRIDAEARDLGPRGADSRYGRGLVCGACRTPAK